MTTEEATVCLKQTEMGPNLLEQQVQTFLLRMKGNWPEVILQTSLHFWKLKSVRNVMQHKGRPVCAAISWNYFMKELNKSHLCKT